MSNQSERRVGTRIEILNDLIMHRASVTSATGQLADFPWDSDDELVVLTRPDVLATLAMFLRDHLTADDLEHWADALEVRDDVGLESAHEDALRQFLYEASTPESEGPLTAEWAEAWVLRLSGLPSPHEQAKSFAVVHDDAFAASLPPLTRLVYLDLLTEAMVALDGGSDPNELGRNGYSVLEMACTRGHEQVVVRLIEQGADVNHADDAGFTPLLHAARSGSSLIAELLIERGANVRATTHQPPRYTPLIRAAEHGRVEVVRRLLDAGVRADESPDGSTALMVAAEWGYLDVLRLLLARGADPSLTYQGESARDMATRMVKPDAVRLLDASR